MNWTGTIRIELGCDLCVYIYVTRLEILAI